MSIHSDAAEQRIRGARAGLARLAGLEQDRSPFDRGKLPRSGVHWVQPRLVAEVGFSEWTTDVELRHPRFQGLRDDKEPAEVTREMPQDTTR